MEPFSPMHASVMAGAGKSGGKHEPAEKEESKGKGGKKPHIHIHHAGGKVHVHVMHDNAPPEVHEHDEGDPGIAEHVHQHYGGGEPEAGQEPF